MNLNTRLNTYLLTGVCVLLGIMYLYPFFSSSITWTFNRECTYENRSKIVIPFGWITGEGAGFVLKKPQAKLSYRALSMFPNELEVSDNGSSLKENNRKREEWFHIYGITSTTDLVDARTYPFTSIGLICGGVGELEPSDILIFSCISPDYRYSFRFSGRLKEIRDASEIAKQIVAR
jgi:hypothetical protein